MALREVSPESVQMSIISQNCDSSIHLVDTADVKYKEG